MAQRASAAQQPASALATVQASVFARVGGQAGLVVALLALAAAAWVATDLRMAGMDAGPGTDPGDLGFFVSTWVVMMAAMMFPSITPMALAYRDLQHERRDRRGGVHSGGIPLFVGGYLAVWTAAGLAGYGLLQAGRSLDGGLFAWPRGGRWLAAGVLVAAALYQLTPSKQACLARCRERRAFVQQSWRDGPAAALRVGFEHGLWCLGCCWALMAALFALGAMSVGWMVLVAALIAAERLLPWRALMTNGVAALIAVIAIGMVAAPAQLPLLTIPGSQAAMRAMGMPAPHHMQGTNSMRMSPPAIHMGPPAGHASGTAR